MAELTEGFATSTENNTTINPGNVLGIVKMELSDFRKSLSGLEVKVERLDAAFEDKFSTVGPATTVSSEIFFYVTQNYGENIYIIPLSQDVTCELAA